MRKPTFKHLWLKDLQMVGIYLKDMIKSLVSWYHMDVSKNSGTPKWMVKIMKNPIKIPWIWGYHYFWKHPYGTLLLSRIAHVSQTGEMFTRPGILVDAFPSPYPNEEALHPRQCRWDESLGSKRGRKKGQEVEESMLVEEILQTSWDI